MGDHKERVSSETSKSEMKAGSGGGTEKERNDKMKQKRQDRAGNRG